MSADDRLAAVAIILAHAGPNWVAVLEALEALGVTPEECAASVGLLERYIDGMPEIPKQKEPNE